MKVSIVIPLYNKENYIVRCLESVANQTVSGFECIVVDDCSTDSSLKECQNFINRYQGSVDFRLIQLERNQGVSYARNEGVRLSKKDYIFFIDADDEITCNCIELFLSVLNKYPESEMIIGEMESIPYNKYYDIDKYKNIDYIDDNDWIRKDFYGEYPRIPVNPNNKLICKKFWHNNSLSYKVGIVHEDELLMYKLVKVLRKLAFVHSTTYMRYYVPNSIITSKCQLPNLRSWAIIFMDIIKELDEPYRRLQLTRYFKEFIIRFKGLDSNCNVKPIVSAFAKEFLKHHEYVTSFSLYRLNNTKNEIVKNQYLEWFQQHTYFNVELKAKNVLKFEISMLRVRLALGKYIKI